MAIDYFGYLGRKESYVFDGGRIAALNDFDAVHQWVKEYENRDGFIYPPPQKTWRHDPMTREAKEVPNTERPALLHRMPSSHSIELTEGGSIEELRSGPSGFLIHLLGFLLGYRLQFHNWWVDGRIPIDRTNDLSISHAVVEDFLSHCFTRWKKWDKAKQQLVTNILFMSARAVHYEWDWERFAIEYMVIDGLWKLSCDLREVKSNIPHKERIRKMCEVYGIPINEECIERAVSLRNVLIHETLWDRGQPCSAGSNEAYMSIQHLGNLSRRIIPAIFAYKTSFVNTGWWHLGRFSFDKAGT